LSNFCTEWPMFADDITLWSIWFCWYFGMLQWSLLPNMSNYILHTWVPCMFNFLGKLGLKAEASKVGEKLESIKFSHGSLAVKFVCFYKLVWPVPLAQVLPHPRLIFPSKTWNFSVAGFWIFSGRNHLKINQGLSNNNTKGTLQCLLNFQLRFNLI